MKSYEITYMKKDYQVVVAILEFPSYEEAERWALAKHEPESKQSMLIIKELSPFEVS